MATTSPIRIDDDLYASAGIVGPVMSRSAAQQIAHWARIGREIEASPHISTAEVAEVLAGARSYDSLDDRQQALVRAAWDETIAADLDGGIDLGAEFRAAGETYSELDENGRIVTHPATN